MIKAAKGETRSLQQDGGFSSRGQKGLSHGSAAAPRFAVLLQVSKLYY